MKGTGFANQQHRRRFSLAAHSVHAESSVMPYRLLITKHSRKAGSAHRQETHRRVSLDHAAADFGGEIVGGGDGPGGIPVGRPLQAKPGNGHVVLYENPSYPIS
jgi:hypothetical protein